MEMRRLPLGAKFSAYWWQRVGGLITRLLHAFLADRPHRAWLYVDDLLAALIRESAHESLVVMMFMLSCLGALISWKKACIGDSLVGLVCGGLEVQFRLRNRGALCSQKGQT